MSLDAGAVEGGQSAPRFSDISIDPMAPTVSARADRTSGRVGDVVSVTVVAIRKRGVVVNVPAADQLGKFQILERREEDRDLGDGVARKEWVLRTAAYEPGGLEIPAITITYLTEKGEVREVRTPAIPYLVEAMTTPEDTELEDISAFVQVFADDYTPIYIVGGWIATGFVVLVALLWRRRAVRKKALEVRPPEPPHVIALERLRRLLNEFDLGKDERKPFFLSMSEILRDYLRARFGLLALTTSELRDELWRREGEGPFSDEAITRVNAWLESCDLVKFARYSASEGEARAAEAELEAIIARLAASAAAATENATAP